MDLQQQITKAVKRSKNFQNFWENNQPLITEYAEQCTGESTNGREPLLPMEEVRCLAEEWWLEEMEDIELEADRKIQLCIGLAIGAFAGLSIALVVINLIR